MLSLAPREPCRRSLWTAAGLLTLSVVLAGVGLAAPGAAAQKDEPKKDEPRKEEPKKAELKKELADKDEPKKTDADKEIDELVEDMIQNLPPGINPAIAKQMREQIRRSILNMTAEQRKFSRDMMRRRNQAGLPGQPGNMPMPPGFGGPRHDARLGARLEPASATLAEQLDLPKGQGLVVREVQPDSAAAKAGLQAHDVLLEFNGKSVANRVEELTRLMADIKPDTAVEVVVLRKGKKETIKDVKLPEAKATPPGFPPGGFQPPGGFPQPPGGFPPPPAGFGPPGVGGQAVITTMTRTRDHFTLRHQEGSLIITLTGTPEDGKVKISAIHVQDGAQSEKHESVDKVPEQYRDKVKNLIEMSEKGSVRIDIKSP